MYTIYVEKALRIYSGYVIKNSDSQTDSSATIPRTNSSSGADKKTINSFLIRVNNGN